MYAKMNNSRILYAPNKIIQDDVIIINPSDEQLAAAGYKEVVEGDIPEEKDGYHVTVKFEDEGDQIRKKYILEKNSSDSIEDRIAALEESQERQNETIDALLFTGV